MAEIDYIRLEKNQTYLDTKALDECFWQLGGSCPDGYDGFVLENFGEHRVNLEKIKEAFAYADAERMLSDEELSKAVREHLTVTNTYVEMDVIQKAYRAADGGIFAYRLVHKDYHCPWNNKKEERGFQGIRLYFKDQEEEKEFLEENEELMCLMPCPKCFKEKSPEITKALEYCTRYNRMPPCEKEYPMNLSWMDVKKEKKKQTKRRVASAGGSLAGGLFDILLVLVVTAVLFFLIYEQGFGELLMNFSKEYFGYAAGFFPTLFTDASELSNFGVVGQEMVLSMDPEISMQGAAWLAFALAAALLFGIRVFYKGWKKKSWQTAGSTYMFLYIKAAVAILLAIPFSCLTIPWAVASVGYRFGKRLAAVLFPWSMLPKEYLLHFHKGTEQTEEMDME